MVGIVAQQCHAVVLRSYENNYDIHKLTIKSTNNINVLNSTLSIC